MQKLTYVNAYGETVCFGASPPVLLRSVTGLSRPDGKIISTQGVYQDGATLERMSVSPRTVSATFDIMNQADREALYALRMRIERVLAWGRAQKDGRTGRLIYENDAGIWRMDAVPDGAITYGTRFLSAMTKNKVKFWCPDAAIDEDRINSAQLRQSGAGVRLPQALPFTLGMQQFRATLTNGGSAAAPMTITLYGTGEKPTLINHTTGARVALERQIASGEQMELSTDPAHLICEIVHADGSREEAWGYLDPAGPVSAFTLTPGDNDIEYVPSAASGGSRVEISWRNRLEGI